MVVVKKNATRRILCTFFSDKEAPLSTWWIKECDASYNLYRMNEPRTTLIVPWKNAACGIISTLNKGLLQIILLGTTVTPRTLCSGMINDLSLSTCCIQCNALHSCTTLVTEAIWHFFMKKKNATRPILCTRLTIVVPDYFFVQKQWDTSQCLWKIDNWVCIHTCYPKECDASRS